MKNINSRLLSSLGILLAAASFNVLAKSSSISNAVSDTAITTNVKAQLATNKMIKISDIKVKTENGVVFLSGVADSNTAAEEAVVTAESAKGVKDVDAKNLTVKDSRQPMEDAYITAKVKGVLIKEKLMNNADVPAVTLHVETQNGVVYFSGEVANDKQAQQAMKLARTVKGVKNVVSNITVSRA